MGLRGVRAAVGIASGGAVVVLSLALASCSNSKVDSKYGVTASRRVVEPGEPVPKGGGVYRVGKPYSVAGHTYVPEENPGYNAEGLASWYGVAFHGRLTANGEVFDMQSISAAHPTLPMPSYVRVTNLANRRSMIVRLNDRGPYHPGRVIDVSERAAQLLGFHSSGTARVRVEYVGRAALEGSDDNKLAATLREGNQAPVAIARATPDPVAPARTRVVAMPPASRAATAPSRSLNSEYFDPRPLTQRPPTSDHPQPPATAAAEPSTSFQSRFGSTTMPSVGNTSTEPVPAYAPGTPARPEGVLTGRGLY